MAVTRPVRDHTADSRYERARAEWSLENARLGGHDAKDHPICKYLRLYISRAPFFAPSRQWAKFVKWRHAGLQVLRARTLSPQ